MKRDEGGAIMHKFIVAIFIFISTQVVAETKFSVLKLQNDLTLLGFDPGPIDGFWGSRTKTAMCQFLDDASSACGNTISEDDLEKLNEAASKSTFKRTAKNGAVWDTQENLQILGIFKGHINGWAYSEFKDALKAYNKKFGDLKVENGAIKLTYNNTSRIEARARERKQSLQTWLVGVDINQQKSKQIVAKNKRKINKPTVANLIIKSEIQPDQDWSGCSPSKAIKKLDWIAKKPLETLDYAGFGALFSNDRTIKQFRPWSGYQLGAKNYLLRWDDERRAKLRGAGADLTAINWAYQWTYGKVVKFYPGVEKYYTNIKYGKDSAHYEPQTAVNVFDQTYSDYIAERAAIIVGKNKTDGIVLDWWHDNHPIVDQTARTRSQFKKKRNEIIQKFRQNLGSNKLIIANVGARKATDTHDNLNGVFIEFIPSWFPVVGYNCRDFLLAEQLLQLHDKHLLPPKVIAFKPMRSLNYQKAQSGFNLQLSRLYAAMAAVVPRNGFIHYQNDDPMNKNLNREKIRGFRFPVYGIDLGGKTSGFTKLKNGVGYREFQHGIVVYNATKNDQKISLPNGETLYLGNLNAAFCFKLKDSFACK